MEKEKHRFEDKHETEVLVNQKKIYLKEEKMETLKERNEER
jgi:hypothetical protein